MKTELPPPTRSYRCSHRLLGPPLHGLQLSCKHFSDLVMQSCDRKLTRGESIRFRIHFILCSVCRRFRKQMHSFDALVKQSLSEQTPAAPAPSFLTSTRARLETVAAESKPPET